MLSLKFLRVVLSSIFDSSNSILNCSSIFVTNSILFIESNPISTIFVVSFIFSGFILQTSAIIFFNSSSERWISCLFSRISLSTSFLIIFFVVVLGKSCFGQKIIEDNLCDSARFLFTSFFIAYS